jgi:hypothetical protein
MFGFQRRRVFTCEWETLFPKLGPLPQISHTDATAYSLRLNELWIARLQGQTLLEARAKREIAEIRGKSHLGKGLPSHILSVIQGYR